MRGRRTFRKLFQQTGGRWRWRVMDYNDRQAATGIEKKKLDAMREARSAELVAMSTFGSKIHFARGLKSQDLPSVWR
jgi:hypothetical protein